MTTSQERISSRLTIPVTFESIRYKNHKKNSELLPVSSRFAISMLREESDWTKMSREWCPTSSAHNLELAVVDAITLTPYLATFEDTVKSVFKFYYYSPKRRREVNEIAGILDQDAICYSGLQKTRWVANRFRAISALERHFLTTVMHLQHKSQTKGDDGAKAKGMLQTLQSEKFVKFMYFLLDVMKVLSDLSKSFQREEFCITDLLVNLEAGISQLDVLRQERGPKYKDFLKRYNEETGVLMCGKEKDQMLKLTRTGTDLEDRFASFIADIEQNAWTSLIIHDR